MQISTMVADLAQPTTRVAQRRWRAGFVLGLSLFGVLYPASPGMSAVDPPAGGLALVKRYLAAHNRGDGETVLGLYADDAVFHLSESRGIVSGPAGLRRLVEFDQAARSHLRPFGASVESAGGVTRVSFRGVVERSAVYAAFGMSRVVTQPIRDAFVVSGDRISVARQPDLLPACGRVLTDAMPLYSAWLKANRPEIFQRLMPGGKLQIEAPLVAPWVTTVRSWRAATGWRPDPVDHAACRRGKIAAGASIFPALWQARVDASVQGLRSRRAILKGLT